MAQQLIGIGATANDGTGDSFRDAFDKTNDNFTELYGLQGADPVVYVASEAGFPTQDATSITLEAGIIYQYTASFTTAKNFIVEDGAKLTAFNFFSPVLTYSGTGSMFTGTDASFTINECRIDCPNAQIFNFSDTVGNQFLFLMDTVRIVSASKFGTFDDLQTIQINNSSSLSMTQGVTISGTNISVLAVDKLFMQSASGSFIGVDLGTSIASTIEIDDLICVGPSGSTGIKGAANSANVPVGVEATVTGCNLSGVTNALDTITVDAIRWRFAGNSGIPDTIEEGLLSFNGNVTETVISTANTPVIVNATWIVIGASFFTGTTGGRLTHDGQRDIKVPIDVAVGLIPSGGGTINVSVYLAKNGAVIANSKTTVEVSGSTQRTLSIPWQDTVSENDYYEVFVENNTNTTNIIVETGRLRIR